MQGSYDVIIQVSGNEYEPVMAYSVDPQNEGGSGAGGYYESGIRIQWTQDGITGYDWYTGVYDSPFYGAAEEDILAEAQSGNLNSYFSKWGSDDSKNREGFIKETIPEGCWSVIFP